MSTSLIKVEPTEGTRHVWGRVKQITPLLHLLLLLILLLLAVNASAAGSADYQRRPFSITVYKGISFYGTNDDDVLNHVVIDLTRGRSARLQGIQVSLLGHEILEEASGVAFGTFCSATGDDMTGVQVAGIGAVSGGDLHGLQFGGLAAVAGGNARYLQAGGLAAVAGNDVTGLQFGTLGAVAGGDIRGFQLSGVAAVSGGKGGLLQMGGLAAVSGDDVHIQAGGLSSVAGGDVTGAQISLLAAVAGDDVIGIQGGGLAAVSGGSTTGLQIGGLAAVNGGSFTGIQASGLASVSGGEVNGLQFSALANVATENRLGQIGSVNVTQRLNGIQAGVINVTQSGNLLQMGIVNVVEEGRGLQLGLLNVLYEERGVLPIGPITRSHYGPEQLEVSYSGYGMTNLGYRTGTSRISSLLTVGFKPGDTHVWSLGMGTGYKIDVVDDRGRIEIEGVWQTLNEGEFWSENPHWIASARLLWSWQFTDRFGVFLGPSYNYYYSKANDGKNILPAAADAPGSAGDPYTQGFITVEAGVRIF